MTTTRKALFVAVVAAGGATLLVLQHQTQLKLRHENESLRQQIDQLRQTTKPSERPSEQTSPANHPQKLADDQFHELLRLRGEVGVLRRETNKISGLREENRRLQDALLSRSANPESSVGKRIGDDAGRLESVIPAGSINWRATDLHQAFQIYAELAKTEIDVDEQVWKYSVPLTFSNSQALTRSEAIRALEGALREQARIETTHPTTNLTVFKLRR